MKVGAESTVSNTVYIKKVSDWRIYPEHSATPGSRLVASVHNAVYFPFLSPRVLTREGPGQYSPLARATVVFARSEFN